MRNGDPLAGLSAAALAALALRPSKPWLRRPSRLWAHGDPLAGLSPAQMAALALRPRFGPQPSWRKRNHAGLRAAPLEAAGSDDDDDSPTANAATATAPPPAQASFDPPPLPGLDLNFGTDPHSYFQPGGTAQQHSQPVIGNQTPIFASPAPGLGNQTPIFGDDTPAANRQTPTANGDTSTPPTIAVNPNSLLQPGYGPVSDWQTPSAIPNRLPDILGTDTNGPTRPEAKSSVTFKGPGLVTQTDWNQAQSPQDPRLPYLTGGTHPATVGFYPNDKAAIMARNPLAFKEKLDAEIEGHPGAYHPATPESPNGSPPGLESLVSAMKKGTRDLSPKVLVFQDGKPYVQPSGPYAGFYVGQTSLADSSKKDSDPSRYINTEQVPTVVYPADDTSSPKLGIDPNKMTRGDLGMIVYQPMYNQDGKEVYSLTDKPVRVGPVTTSPVIYGDRGPRRGEASMAAVRNLKVNATPKSSPLSEVHDRVLYIGFPGSRFHPDWPVTQEQMNNRSRQLYQQWGGDARATESLTPNHLK